MAQASDIGISGDTAETGALVRFHAVDSAVALSTSASAEGSDVVLALELHQGCGIEVSMTPTAARRLHDALGRALGLFRGHGALAVLLAGAGILGLPGCAGGGEVATAAPVDSYETGPANASEVLPDGTVRRYRLTDDGREVPHE